ncbi:MAG: cyclic nucleotide-binding domain-containing protein [Aquisalimonadaceae bacterium]
MSNAGTRLKVTDDRIELLRGMAVFGALDDDTLRFILGRAQVVTVPEGEYFIRQDEVGDAAFALEYGQVIFIKTYQGHDYRMRILKTGDCFAEMALLGLYPRSGSVRAMKDSQAIRINYEILADLYERDPRQHTTILMNMARDLSRRLRDADDRLVRYLAAQRRQQKQ